MFQMKKQDKSPEDAHTHAHIYTKEYYLSHKKNEIFSYASTWIILEGIMR